MTDSRKERERAELFRVIWNIANDLRGSVDGWDFKQYVLGMLFYRYISENLAVYINEGEQEAGNAGFDYAELSDVEAEEARAGLVAAKGFFILPSELFENVRRRAAQDENLNENRPGRRWRRHAPSHSVAGLAGASGPSGADVRAPPGG